MKYNINIRYGKDNLYPTRMVVLTFLFMTLEVREESLPLSDGLSSCIAEGGSLCDNYSTGKYGIGW